MEGSSKKRKKKAAEPEVQGYDDVSGEPEPEPEEERGDINPPEIEAAFVPPPANQVRVEMLEAGEPTGHFRNFGHKTAMGLIRRGKARYAGE